MYRMFKSLWFTKEDVNFVVLEEGAILVKFDNIEDRKRVLNLSPWLFDQCLIQYGILCQRHGCGVLCLQLYSILGKNL